MDHMISVPEARRACPVSYSAMGFYYKLRADGVPILKVSRSRQYIRKADYQAWLDTILNRFEHPKAA